MPIRNDRAAAANALQCPLFQRLSAEPLDRLGRSEAALEHRERDRRRYFGKLFQDQHCGEVVEAETTIFGRHVDAEKTILAHPHAVVEGNRYVVVLQLLCLWGHFIGRKIMRRFAQGPLFVGQRKVHDVLQIPPDGRGASMAARSVVERI